MDLEAIERAYLDQIELAGEALGAAIGVPHLGATLRSDLQLLVQQATGALEDAISAGDTAEQFAARLEALKES